MVGVGEGGGLRFRLHHSAPVIAVRPHPVSPGALVTLTADGEMGKWEPETELLQVTVSLGTKTPLALATLVETEVAKLLAAVLVTRAGALLLVGSLSRKEEENPEPAKLANSVPTQPHQVAFTVLAAWFLVSFLGRKRIM